MYHNYFGLKEPAFSIAVNPHYLYMSQQHKEALAHLLFGVQGGGFVLLSGEVGTGKTTIIRCLLEHLPENTDIAIVLNPMANVREMLSTICDELGTPYIKDSPSQKDYTDALYDYLLNNYSQGRNTVLLIDEAQALSAEALEQIRLLTNLETTRQKLLQIILVGQPELNELLAQSRLRQLSQRITARFHLKPLTELETRAYIAHRLGVAGLPEGRNPFPPSIIKRIYNFSGGIPRLINILCERSLIGAYGHNKVTVDKEIFEQAKREVTGNVNQSRSPYATRYWRNTAAIAISLAGILALLVLYFVLDASEPHPPEIASATILGTGQIEKRIEPLLNPIPSNAPAPEERETPDETLSSATNGGEKTTPQDIFISNKNNSINALFNHLGYNVDYENQECWEIGRTTPECANVKLETWTEFQQLNRPSVLKIRTPDKFESYAIIIGIKDHSALLIDKDAKQHTMPLSELGPLWTGDVFYLWHRPPGFGEQLGIGSSSGTVTWLAEQFAKIDEQPEPLTQRKFNKALQERVKIFQRSFGLKADGIVGKQTILRLNELLDVDRTLITEG